MNIEFPLRSYSRRLSATRSAAVLLCMAAGLLFPACSGARPGTGKPVVAVSILPQSYFVSRIAGGRAEILCLVGPGQSPHSYEPSPKQMATLSKASAWLTVGVDFERALKPKVAALYPKLAIVDTAAGVEYRTLEAHSHGEEDEQGEDGHVEDEHGDESGPDQHIWLGREAVKVQAANIRDALSAMDPAGAAAYAANCEAFVAELESVFAELKAELSPMSGKTAFVFHPSFGYFLDEFGIEQEAVETGGKEPTQKGLAALIAEARADGAKVVFVQKQFPARAAKTVAQAIGGRVAEIDPLAPDWLDNLKRMGAALKASEGGE